MRPEFADGTRGDLDLFCSDCATRYVGRHRSNLARSLDFEVARMVDENGRVVASTYSRDNQGGHTTAPIPPA